MRLEKIYAAGSECRECSIRKGLLRSSQIESLHSFVVLDQQSLGQWM